MEDKPVSPPAEPDFPIAHPQLSPIEVPLPDNPEDSVYICQCGQSKKFPLCDGAHKQVNADRGTSIGPFAANRATYPKGSVWVCGCGYSSKRTGIDQAGEPFCDGTHKRVNQILKDNGMTVDDLAKHGLKKPTSVGVVVAGVLGVVALVGAAFYAVKHYKKSE